MYGGTISGYLPWRLRRLKGFRQVFRLGNFRQVSLLDMSHNAWHVAAHERMPSMQSKVDRRPGPDPVGALLPIPVLQAIRQGRQRPGKEGSTGTVGEK